MKKLFTLIALGSVTFVSADPYGRSDRYQSGNCPSCNGGDYYQDQDQSYNRGGNYQGQASNGNYNEQYSQQNPYGSQQQSQRNQSYRQNQPYGQNQAYGQNDQNQSYGQNQQDSQNQAYGQNQPYGQNKAYGQNDQNRPYGQNQQYSQQQQPRNADNYSVNQNANDQKVVSDQDISKSIRKTLGSGWFSKGFQDVSFDVNNGNVNLTGSVDTLENKNKVEASIKKIDGVRQVNNQITIEKDNSNSNDYASSELQNSEKKYPQDFASTMADRQLNAKIRDKLSNGWFSKGNETLVIKTSDGIVVVTGTVDKDEDIQKLTDSINEIEGVKSVNNQLTVKNK